MESRSDLTRSEAVAAITEMQRDLRHLAQALTACLDGIDAPKNRRTYLALIHEQARDYRDATLAMVSDLDRWCPPIGPDGHMRYTVAQAIDASMAGRAHIGRVNSIAQDLMNSLPAGRATPAHDRQVQASGVLDTLGPFWNRSEMFYDRAAGWGEQ